MSSIDGKLHSLTLETDPASISRTVEEMRILLDSEFELLLQVETGWKTPEVSFLPTEIVPNGTYRRILEEVNKCFANGCFNACAAMLRRLVESLIIDAFEAARLENEISKNGEYYDLKALISIATTELKLGRNTRAALPKLKFFGDMSMHCRKNLIRHDDLNRIHSEIRVAVEELAGHCFSQ
jgi:hypothetical protein